MNMQFPLLLRIGCLMLVALAAAAQPVIQNARLTNGNSQVTFTIGGGSGPFVVGRANNVNDPMCSIAAVAQRSVTLSADGPRAFFAVRDLTDAPNTRFTVYLTGLSERPTAITNSADGFGTLELSGNSLTFDIAFRNLSSGVSAAHIHASADTSVTAGIALDFAPYIVTGFGTNGGRIAGNANITPALKAAIVAGLAYVNVHTTNHGPGEIRGQITPAAFKVVLTGAAERPNAVERPAFGFGALTLLGRELSYHINYHDLTGPATAAHIHGPAGTATAAPIMYDLVPRGGFGKSGTLAGRVTLTPAQIAAIVDGKAYANIHTVLHGPGEIRGQVSPLLGETAFSAELTGAAERPNPVTTTGSGFTVATLHSNVLSFTLVYRDLPGPATAAHIHGAASTSASAPILFDLLPYHRGSYSTQGVFVGAVTLNESQINHLLNGDLYMNIHTLANQPGEIRGQLSPMVFAVNLNGANERPTPVSTPATGYGYVAMAGKQFSIGLNYRGLLGPADAAHIHGPADTNGFAGISIDLGPYNAGGFGHSGFLLGSQAVNDTQAAHFVDFLNYVNIHSTVHGGGEIRGQVLP